MTLTLELLTPEVDLLLTALREYADKHREDGQMRDAADTLILKLEHALATGSASPSVPKVKV